MARIDNKEFTRLKNLLKRASVAQVAQKSGHAYYTIKKIDAAYSWQEYKNPSLLVIRKQSLLDRLKSLIGR